MQAELYDALIAAGAPESKAKAAAEAITSYRKTDEVATKGDIAELESRLTWRIVVCMGINLTAIAVATAIIGILTKT